MKCSADSARALAALAALALAACADDPTRPADVTLPGRVPSAGIIGFLPVVVSSSVTDLGTLGAASNGRHESRAYGVNDSGVVTGASTKPATWSDAVFRWRSGTGMTWTGTLGTGRDINLGGTIVGESFSIPGGGNGEGFALSAANVMTPLGFLPNDYASFATGINDAGHIVGTSDEGNPAVTGYVNAGVRWDPGTLAMTAYLPASGYPYRASRLFDINSAQQSVGYADDFGSLRAGFRYTPGTGYELIKPWSSTVRLWPLDINEAGTVTGWERSAGGDFPFRWSPAMGFSYLSGGGHALGINEHGRTVGHSNSAPVMWTTAGARIALPRLAGAAAVPCGEWECAAQAVNGSGMMVGYDRTAGGDVHAVLWQTLILYKVIVEFYPNRWPKPYILLGAGELLPFAVLAEEKMDVRTIDPRILRLGNGEGAGVPVARNADGKLLASYQDVDRDGDLDLLVHFDQAALEKNGVLTAETTVLHLTGDLGGGESLGGAYKVQVAAK
jgi:uncharacterized membrane protein